MEIEITMDVARLYRQAECGNVQCDAGLFDVSI